jgi:hypothetical protein
LVFSIHDSTEVAIQKMIEASQRMLTVNSQGELGGLSPPQKRHLELEIETLENAPRDAEKLEKLLKAKQRQKEEAWRFDIPKPKIIAVGRNVILGMDYNDVFKYKVDRNAPLPTGEPVEKLGELDLPFEIRSEGSNNDEKEQNRKRT